MLRSGVDRQPIALPLAHVRGVMTIVAFCLKQNAIPPAVIIKINFSIQLVIITYGGSAPIAAGQPLYQKRRQRRPLVQVGLSQIKASTLFLSVAQCHRMATCVF